MKHKADRKRMKKVDSKKKITQKFINQGHSTIFIFEHLCGKVWARLNRVETNYDLFSFSQRYYNLSDSFGLFSLHLLYLQGSFWKTEQNFANCRVCIVTTGFYALDLQNCLNITTLFTHVIFELGPCQIGQKSDNNRYNIEVSVQPFPKGTCTLWVKYEPD